MIETAPRIGDVVLLEDGSHHEVLAVQRAPELLRNMGELDARAWGDSMRARLGEEWMARYFRLVLLDKRINQIVYPECFEVREIL